MAREFVLVIRTLVRCGPAALSALALVFLTARPPAAQSPPTPNYVWNNFVGGTTTWSTGNNWVPAGPPPSGIDQILGFGSSSLQTAGGYTSTFDTVFDLNSLVFNSFAASNTQVTL